MKTEISSATLYNPRFASRPERSWIKLLALALLILCCTAGVALMYKFGGQASSTGVRLLDSLNTLISSLSFIAVLWGLRLQRAEVRLQFEEEKRRAEKFLAELQDLQRLSRLNSYQSLLLAISSYVATRKEARASIPGLRSSCQAEQRLAEANKLASRALDRLMNDLRECLQDQDEIRPRGT